MQTLLSSGRGLIVTKEGKDLAKKIYGAKRDDLETSGTDSVPRGGVLGSIFAGYVPLASPNPYPIIVYSVANHRPHLSHF